MNLAATFYISVYGLVALSGGILAWAEQTPSVTALTAPVAICALLLNERYGVVRLNTLWSGVVGLVMFLYPAYEMRFGNEEARLLALAHLVTMLQWVLLFHKKPAHQYWWLCAMSCVQIALASVLTSSPMFGLLILIYMFWALWTLSVFTLFLARLRYGRDERVADEPGGWTWPELAGKAPRPARQPGSAAIATPVSEFRSSFQCDPHETDISWRFVLGVGSMSATALLLGLVFFLLTPRLWIAENPFQETSLEAANRALTGFSERVQLGDFGRILESSAPVLELNLVDEQTGKPLALLAYLDQIGQDEPLLRGTVLEVYRRGEWFPASAFPATNFPGTSSYLRGRSRKFVRQTIRLEPIGTRTLFSLVDPEYGIVEDQMESIKVIQESRSLHFRPVGGPVRGALRYHLLAPQRPQNAPRNHYHVSSVTSKTDPSRPGLTNVERAFGTSNRLLNDAYLLCSSDYKIIRELADRLVQRTATETGTTVPKPSQIASMIVAHLRDSGEFRYSLDQSRNDPTLDPVEDFLKNGKSGHCQYFATSLALLLRAAGIPTRMVTGFKGGIEAGEIGRLEVQQRHAHAWVEAYLEDEWVTLDATPASREESVEAIGDRMRWYHQIFAYFSSVWNEYVVNLSFTRQQRDVYGPLQNLGMTVTKQVRSTTSFWQFLQANVQYFWQHPERWFSLRGGLTALLLMLSIVGLFYLLRGLIRLGYRLVLGPSADKHRATYVEFYERFVILMKPLGLVPKPHQTQLEFAQQVEDAWLAQRLPLETLPLAREISLAYYRLRFGAETLRPEEEEQIRAGLAQLERHLRGE